MSIAEKLAILTIKSPKLEPTIRATIRRFSWEDVAGAMAGTSRGAYLLIRYKWCGDESVENELRRHTLAKCTEFDTVKRRTGPPGSLTALCDLALWDVCAAHRCKACSGTGWKYSDSVSVCKKCQGLGYEYLSLRKKALALGCDPKTYKKKNEGAYKDVFSMLIGWEIDGLTKIQEHLG